MKVKKKQIFDETQQKMSRKYMQHKQHKAVFFNVKPPHWHVM